MNFADFNIYTTDNKPLAIWLKDQTGCIGPHGSDQMHGDGVLVPAGQHFSVSYENGVFTMLVSRDGKPTFGRSDANFEHMFQEHIQSPAGLSIGQVNELVRKYAWTHLDQTDEQPTDAIKPVHYRHSC